MITGNKQDEYLFVRKEDSKTQQSYY